MNKLTIGLLLFFAITSCKKDIGTLDKSEVPNPTVSKGYFPLAIGNYWVYQKYWADTLENATSPIVWDTMKITRDTIINGYKFFDITGYSWFPDTHLQTYIRDSSGYLVYADGNKFCPTNFVDTFQIYTIPNQLTLHVTMSHPDSNITIPLGIFTTNALTYTYHYLNSSPQYSHRTNHIFYTKDVGIAKQVIWHGNTYQLSITRLMAYKIN